MVLLLLYVAVGLLAAALAVALPVVVIWQDSRPGGADGASPYDVVAESHRVLASAERRRAGTP